MPAPKGNQNATKPGTDKMYRVRVDKPDDHLLITDMTPEERGAALLEWIKKQSSKPAN